MFIESPKKTIDKSPEVVFAFLNDVNNYKQLMPDSISKFEILSDKRFLFALKGMPDIVLELKNSIPYNKVVLGAASEKLPFTLTANIKELTDQSSEAYFEFEGEFNAMMSMMIKAPITKFIQTLTENLQNI
ncbi:SRPBCC family protein [Leeuwenhoekiella sp. NPDC079379]|uniref:SRPBCC family protein n=1 Tax=Leeuwenhoekiella sp. NPDC079379 TaxID=3364122 RepID=UPI0037CA5478